MGNVTASVFTKTGTAISCKPLKGGNVDTNILTIGDAYVFADNATLDRISDAIEARLIEIVNEKHELIVEPDPAEAVRFAEEQAREARGEPNA